MLTTKKRKPPTGRPPKPENRTRTRNLVIRMSDEERTMLDELAPFLGQPNASEVFRFLVRREAEVMRARGSRARKRSAA